MQPRLPLALFLAFLGSAIPLRALDAQSEQQDPHIRNDCRLAAQVLETGHPAPHHVWALDFITRCEQSGAPALAALWQRPPADSGRLEQLFFASYRLRDSRLTRAVVDAAANRTLPQLVRLNALRVLAGHAAPEFLLSLSDLLRQDSEIVRYQFPSVDHVNVRNGQAPVGGATIQEILVALDRMDDDPDPVVARAALRTRRQVCLRLGADGCR